jgi:formate dehydrogenase iron-sulfur subunit
MFGDLDELRDRAERRVEELHARGMHDAVLYDPRDTSVGGIHAMFIVRGDPEAYNLPMQPEVPTIYLRDGWRSAAVAALAAVVGAAVAFAGRQQ